MFAGTRDECTPAESEEPASAFPTEERLRQMERHKKRKEAGLEKFATKRTKVVEQHFDDCGEDLSSIVDVKQLLYHDELLDAFSDTETEPDEEPDLEANDINVALQASLLGSDASPEQWASRQRTFEASDLAEFMALLAEAQPRVLKRRARAYRGLLPGQRRRLIRFRR